jgi:predicted RNA-binding Zn ribbon-like protein
VRFNSHVERLMTTTVGLVNVVTAGEDGGRPVDVPTGEALRDAVADAVRTEGYDVRPSLAEARALHAEAQRARRVFEALAAGDDASAARLVNEMLVATKARPQLDVDESGAHSLHFHGPDDSFARGWAAGIAAGLAMAIGGDLGSRLGVCSAPACDRVYVDLSKNSHRRFCSTRCQNRVKTAAYRERARRP